jgi:hypothetical protein
VGVFLRHDRTVGPDARDARDLRRKRAARNETAINNATDGRAMVVLRK